MKGDRLSSFLAYSQSRIRATNMIRVAEKRGVRTNRRQSPSNHINKLPLVLLTFWRGPAAQHYSNSHLPEGRRITISSEVIPANS